MSIDFNATMHDVPSPVNSEGMTWPEWQCAAHALQATNVAKGVLWKAWQAGEDPTEYANLSTSKRDDQFIMASAYDPSYEWMDEWRAP